MAALVGDRPGRLLRRRRGADGGQVGCSGSGRRRQGRGVAPVGGMDLGRDDGAAVRIERMPGPAGQPGAAVLQPGDLGLRIGRCSPVQSALDSRLPCRRRSSRIGSSAAGVRCRLPWPAARASPGSPRQFRAGRSSAAPRWPRSMPAAAAAGPAPPPGESAEPGLDQHRLQAVAEAVPRRARQLRPAHHQLRLPPQPHARPRSRPQRISRARLRQRAATPAA